MFTYVIAHQDPGVHNWLDTGGLEHTIFGQRWQSFPGGAAREEPVITSRLVKLDDLDKALPPGVRRIDPVGRHDQLVARRGGFDRRFLEN